VTFGFDTAMLIATEAIDRLHSTAHSHHRIIVVEVMGHNAGWLTLGAGIAGGADVILIPEIPYDVEKVAEDIRDRRRRGTGFSIVAVAEGAMTSAHASQMQELRDEADNAKSKDQRKKAKQQLEELERHRTGSTLALSTRLEELTALESRVTILGHLQRGGAPSAGDRLLATRLGTACTDIIEREQYGVMVAARGEGTQAVPLGDVVGRRKTVPPDHPWIASARHVGTSFGD
jgi:6-phosphofructokinase 1